MAYPPAESFAALCANIPVPALRRWSRVNAGTLPAQGITENRQMPSFDAVSEIDSHELTNAVDQANREVASRFDFRNSGAKFTLKDFDITLEAPTDYQLKQMMIILTEKLAKREIDVNSMKADTPDVSLHLAKQKVSLTHGIDTDHARKIVRLIKDSKLKVQAQIQGEQVRVTGKKRDDLQAVMQMLKKGDLGLPLQFTNFRD